MGKYGSPRRGSRMFRRNRAKSAVPRIRGWPDKEGVLGFAAYKAGLTHAIVVETNKGHPLVGTSVRIPITVLEAPPLVVAGIRAYQDTPYGRKVLTEVWAEKLPKELERRIRLPKQPKTQDKLKKLEEIREKIGVIRLITCTQPYKVGAVPKKVPEIIEQAIGGNVEAQLSKAKELLGKELKVGDVFKIGDPVDVFAITKGHGFQGVIKRFGVKLQKRKIERARKIGTLGPVTPAKVLPSVPQAGQMGYQQRYVLNQRVFKIEAAVNPKGGWNRYGVTSNDCLLIKGILPGPTKRLIRLRAAMRKTPAREIPEIDYLHKISKK